MRAAAQLYRWNAWFDAADPGLRFDLAVWAFAALGLLNLILSIGFGMAFGLLPLIGLVVGNLLRLPYALGELPEPLPAPLPWAQRIEAWRAHMLRLPQDVVSLPNLALAVAAISGIGALAGMTSRCGLAFGVLFLLAMLNTLVLLRGRRERTPQEAGIREAGLA